MAVLVGMDRTQLTNGILCALDDETYDLLAGHLAHHPFRRGELLQEQNEPVRRIFFPHSGAISLLIPLSDGAAVETATIGRESGVGLTAALAPSRSFNRAVGQADGLTSSIDAERLRHIVQDSPRLRDVIVRHGEALMAQAHQAVACNALHAVEARFCRWLLTCQDRTDRDEIVLTQELLAMMLGVQRTTVTQVAGVLQAAGLIRVHRGRIEIVDRRGLERRTCECYRTIRTFFEETAPDPAPDGPCATAA